MAVLSQRYRSGTITLTYEWEEAFRSRPPKGSLQIVLVEEGCVALRINRDRCYLQAGALLFLHDDVQVERIHQQGLKAKSVSFPPGFINLNLTMENIRRGDFEALREQFGYPSFHLFLDWGMAYAGVLPLDAVALPKAGELMDAAIRQLDCHTDDYWACRTRVSLLELLQLAEREYARFTEELVVSTPLARNVLEYIHANYDKDISVEALCERYHTNHTTLLRDFRRLTGMTVGRYILKYRLDLAKEALLFTSLTVDEIAEKCGFKQASYFSRVFRREAGVPPGRFRAREVAQRKAEQGGFAPAPPSWSCRAAASARAQGADGGKR
ncbi:MAG TPA: AraC family transcriptional regulator [Firmicutes bacterium]|nr:AraC family transcriptional regulator [Bacillota bacterium]